MTLATLLAADVVTPEEVDACGQEPGAACLWVFRATDSAVPYSKFVRETYASGWRTGT